MKKLWLCEQYAQKAWTLSLVLAQEAARAGAHGKGFAVVASEARMIADKLFEYAATMRFDHNDTDFKGIADFAVMLKFLSTNAAFEIIHVAETNMEFNIPKSMTVFADEMRRLAHNINELAEKSVWDKPFTVPEMAKPSGSSAIGHFFKYSINRYSLIENANLIREVCLTQRADIEGESFSLRGQKMPIINFYQRLGLPYESKLQTVMIVCPDGNPWGNVFAVPIDDLDISAIFASRNGIAVQPQKDHKFAEFSRECWNSVGGNQFIFIDWKKFIE